MGRSNRPKEKNERGGELPQHDSNDGTSARTRPISYDEIMLRRNSKKVNENSENVEEGNTEGQKIAKDNLIRNDFNANKSGGGRRHGKDFSAGHEKRVSEEMEKRSFHKKVENESRRSYSLSKLKNRENHELEKRLKSEVNKDMERLKSEVNKDMVIKDDGKYEKQIQLKRKNERPAGGSETVGAKKHSRDLVERDRHAGRIGGKSERDSKRKHQTRDDEQNRERNTTKKHDMRKEHTSETSDRKEKKESSRSHYKESHHKRRRSQSQEHEDRHRRSTSLSPRHKRSSGHLSEHELFLHVVKGRNERQHSDDRSRMTSNGSSGHHRRHGGSTSGLGGYSPRKRKTEAAHKTPSPPHRSTEKRTAKWDLAPAETEKMISGSVSSNLQASSQMVSLNMHAVASSVPSVSFTGKPLVGAITSSLSSKHTVSSDSVQLTEATRPMRRLYVENMPAATSEKAIMEFFNNFLLSSGSNHIQGTQPCISCIINKGKGQALVEFLTPEDASAAHSFDGRTFCGSILKIRRPKDFVEVTGEPEKSDATVTTVSDVVKDSHYKIFVGGISKALSSEMFVEIANAFGPLKTYHFEINEDLSERYAILEYIDESVSLKACAGLNGMKLGGQVLTSVQAFPDDSSSGNDGDQQSFIIPQLAWPLLQKPTQVLKLKNLFPEGFSSLSEAEVEEVLEDVRLECSRFGTIKSVNIVKHANGLITTGESIMDDNMRETGTRPNVKDDEINVETETRAKATDGKSRRPAGIKFPSDYHEAMAGNRYNDEKSAGNLVHNVLCQQGELEGNTNSKDISHGRFDAELCQLGGLDCSKDAGFQLATEMAVEDLALDTVDKTVSQEVPTPMNTLKEESDDHSEGNGDNMESEATNVNKILAAEKYSNLEEVNGKLSEGYTEVAVEDPAAKNVLVTISQGISRLPNTPKEELDSQYDNVAANIRSEAIDVEKKLVPKEDLQLQEANGKFLEAIDGSAGGVRMDSDTIKKDENGMENNVQHIFEPGCVFVEYRRIEASSMAAHSIHGRLFDDRIVTVEYIDPDIYRVKFPK